MTGCCARGHAAQERHGVDDVAGVGGGDVHSFGQVCADRDEHGIEGSLAALELEVVDPVVAGQPHPERGDPIDLGAHHIPRQPVGGNPVAHHPARLRAGVANLDLVAEPREVVGGRQTARTRADHEHALAGPRPRGIEQPALLEREITEEPLDRVNRQRAVELGTVADALTRVVTDPTVDRGKRVLGGQQAPRLLVLARP